MNTRPKIKVLFRHRSMEMGGVEKVLLSLLKNLDPEKFEMTVCLNLNQGELRNEIPSHVRKVFLATGKEDFSANKILRRIQLFQRKQKLERLRRKPHIIDKFYLGETYDIEIAMTYNDFESVLNSTNKTSKKIGWFHSEINLPKLQPLVPEILKNFPRFDRMVYCSENIKKLMHDNYPQLSYPNESVITNAIDIEEIKRKADETIPAFPDAPVFVSVGRLHSRKGYHKLLVAHEKLLKDGLQHAVIVIGDGEELPNLLALRKDLGVEKTFHFAGNQMNPYPFMKNADFFILPSESEAWPLVIAEAMILEKPIISTDVGDVGKMLQHLQTGFLIEYDTEQIYRAMKQFLTDDQLVLSLKKNLKNAEELFDNAKIFSDVENMLVTLTGEENSDL